MAIREWQAIAETRINQTAGNYAKTHAFGSLFPHLSTYTCYYPH